MSRVRSRIGSWLCCPGVAAAALLLSCPPSKGGTAPPKERDISYYYDCFEHSLPRPIARQLDPARWVRRIAGRPKEALNLDDDDQVRLPSTWWQPRLGFRAVTVEQMIAGPGPGTGPAPGRWTVTKGKGQGVTPGFFIKDRGGVGFLLKFDPPDYAEMASASDVIASHLFWAAGYNVPDNAIVYFRPESLDIAPHAVYEDARSRKRPLTHEHLREMLAKTGPLRDGSYRAMASRLLKGKLLGPFLYRGTRMDDPEDLIPHEHRRELRGLWTLAAWMNHADVRAANSMDVWVADSGRSFVRHYLIDFGSCLGSASTTTRTYQTGTEYYLDFNVMGRALCTAGLAPFAWEGVMDPNIPCIGFIEASAFDPSAWRPDYPNPAFDERTERDIRWGARIIAAFTDEQIRAAVALGKFSDPRAAEYLTRVLIQRRDRLAQRWLPAPRGTGPPLP